MNTTDSIILYSKEGTNEFEVLQTIALDDTYGSGKDVSFGLGEIWAAQGPLSTGHAITYPFTVPAVPEASVSVTVTNGLVTNGLVTNGLVAVGWWRWVGAGGGWRAAHLQAWSVLTNAPQPLLLSPTNTQQFFRAVKQGIVLGGYGTTLGAIITSATIFPSSPCL